MAVLMLIIALLLGGAESLKDQYDYYKWKQSGGMESRYDCWKK